MQYVIRTGEYNEKRYGKPWLGVIGASLTRGFAFVDWEGRLGKEGEFRFDAEPGTLLARGQKDVRKGKGGIDEYLICLPDGETAPIGDTLALDLKSLETGERVEVCAKRKHESIEKKLNGPMPPHMRETYWESEKDRLRDRMEYWMAMWRAETEKKQSTSVPV